MGSFNAFFHLADDQQARFFGWFYSQSFILSMKHCKKFKQIMQLNDHRLTQSPVFFLIIFFFLLKCQLASDACENFSWGEILESFCLIFKNRCYYRVIIVTKLHTEYEVFLCRCFLSSSLHTQYEPIDQISSLRKLEEKKIISGKNELFSD